MVSSGRSGNQSNTGVVECPPEFSRARWDCAGRGTLVRMRMLWRRRACFRRSHWLDSRSGSSAALIPELEEFNLHPGWIVLGECLRSGFYALFLCFPIAAFLTHESPRSRDDRLVITLAALGATFLLVGLRLLVPSGPELWHPSHSETGVAVVMTLGGVALALAQRQFAGFEVLVLPSRSSTRGERAVSMGPPSDLSGGTAHDPGGDGRGTAGSATAGRGRRRGSSADPDPRRRAPAPLDIPWIRQVCSRHSLSARPTAVVSGEAPGPERAGGRSLNGPGDLMPSKDWPWIGTLRTQAITSRRTNRMAPTAAAAVR